MSGFSADWLDLREAADRKSRNGHLGRLLAAHFADRTPLTVIDLGCGTGANLRAVAPLLGLQQDWTLIDIDRGLLEAAKAKLVAWSDRAEWTRDRLTLIKGHCRIDAAFRHADVRRGLGSLIGTRCDLVTASALFDLVSQSFIGELAAAVIERGAGLYSVLTYNGLQRWTPEHAADAAMTAAFHAHQGWDKGFGPAAGPLAPARLAEAFRAAGWRLYEGDSSWRLGGDDERLIDELARGFAAAVRETGLVDGSTIEDWLQVKRSAAVVGHSDTLALPPP
jgi:SAM-dependent methyltransferase